MGFIRRQEEQMALRLLEWQYKRMNIPLPVESELKHRADKLVDDAHQIARKRGKNVLSIIKDLVGDLKK
ncbi:MAG: hypothetical protein V3S05_06055 [Desulfobacterales bacterium]|jgi:hypothetical protein|uniref:Uncharacterized protein n=1 Tax=marine sediment metagenome TaxID=412755 RepID=A0A0F9CRF2_9ZZZZ|nr:hypothetical protein [Desulfobacterales bacterium]